MNFLKPFTHFSASFSLTTALLPNGKQISV